MGSLKYFKITLPTNNIKNKKNASLFKTQKIKNSSKKYFLYPKKPRKTNMPYKPVVLVILDGWGEGRTEEGNAIKHAQKPTIDKLDHYYPLTLIQASGSSVGLPWGESGNSEVGHITLGTGRIVYQNMPRITLSIQDGSFFSNFELIKAFKNAETNQSAVHLMGLIGQGSVHSYLEHLYALLEFAKRRNTKKLFLHLFTDGRDCAPQSGADTLSKIQERLKNYGVGKIASIVGRNWAMDRNNNWNRIEKTYKLLTEGIGEPIQDPVFYLQECYKKNISDEFIEPGCVINRDTKKPVATIQDGDSVIFFNFREDRARQLTKAFALPDFTKFTRTLHPRIEFVTFVEYEKDLPVSIAFPQQDITNTLGEVLSKRNKTQLRISETEKYAHVTYFFNGGQEDPWPGEDHILIPSPVVPSFDRKPEMSAYEITEKLIKEIEKNQYDFILVNYANADMVGHTGIEEATIQGVQHIDACLSKLIPVVLRAGGCLLITADHGNAEETRNLQTGQRDTEHSANPVPLWFVTANNHHEKPNAIMLQQKNEVVGLLSDVAPTVLDIMEIKKPSEMLGSSLLPLFQ